MNTSSTVDQYQTGYSDGVAATWDVINPRVKALDIAVTMLPSGSVELVTNAKIIEAYLRGETK